MKSSLGFFEGLWDSLRLLDLFVDWIWSSLNRLESIVGHWSLYWWHILVGRSTLAALNLLNALTLLTAGSIFGWTFNCLKFLCCHHKSCKGRDVAQVDANKGGNLKNASKLDKLID